MLGDEVLLLDELEDVEEFEETEDDSEEEWLDVCFIAWASKLLVSSWNILPKIIRPFQTRSKFQSLVLLIILLIILNTYLVTYITQL